MQQYKKIAYGKVMDIEKRTFSEFCQEQNSISLLNGLSGMPFFYWNLYQLNKEEEALSRMGYIIDKVLEHAGNPANVLTYCDGLAGMGYMLNYFKAKEIIDDDIEGILCELDEILMEEGRVKVEEGYLDFLHGALGILHYLFQRAITNEPVKKYAEEMGQLLLGKIKSEVSLGSTTNASIYDGVEIKHLNLGMAHGLVSVLAFLAKYYNSFSLNQDVKDVAGLILNVFEKYECTDGQSVSIYPSIVSDHGQSIYNVPLGWCYGDSVTALAMARYANAISCDHLLHQANHIAHFTLKRDTLAAAHVFDGCLCHGATSNVQIYRNLYQATGDARYLKAYENWIVHTINIGNEPDGIGGYKRFYGDGSRNMYGILDGAAGVGLVLMDFISGSYTDWDQLLLLN
jgi:lantibiotic biosynthesis protein